VVRRNIREGVAASAGPSMSFPTKLEDVADYLDAIVVEGERASAEDRLAHCLAIENMTDALARLARAPHQENLIRSTVNVANWYLREENVNTLSARHTFKMALNRLRY
jgi:hypothetical protein